ncbi:MAG: DUF4350 domain-containing protein [Tahibacter sp.]
MNRRSWSIAAALLLSLGCLAAWWFYTFERVEESVDAPMRGEARYNPLFALKKTLQAQGVKVSSRANLNLRAMALKPGDTLVLGADVRTLSRDQASEIIGWVETGGHLLFALPQGSEGRDGELLDALALTVVERRNCLYWRVRDAEKPAEHCFRFGFQVDEDEVDQFAFLRGNNEQGYTMGHRLHGDGSWTVAGDLDFLRNHELRLAGNDTFTWQILGSSLHGGTVHLVYAADVPPLYVLIVERGWPVLLPTLLALFTWLWMRAQRLGPVLPITMQHRRALREHIQASGEFSFRRGRAAGLHAAVRRRFLEHLRHRDPVIAALPPDDLVSALAKQHQRSVSDVRHALNPEQLIHPDAFFAAIKTLVQLRNRP